MSTKLGKYLVVLPILSLLTACAQLGQMEAQNTDSREMPQSAKTYSDHDKLADYHDNLAKEMVAKAEEKKELLEEYENHSYYYGRQGQDLRSHTVANIRYYEQAAKKARREADAHQKIAAELLQREYAKPAEIPGQQGNRTIKAILNSNTGNF